MNTNELIQALLYIKKNKNIKVGVISADEIDTF